MQWVPAASSPEAKLQAPAYDHSLPSNAEITNTWFYTPAPPTLLHGVVLINYARENIYYFLNTLMN
jgi:hypothetical protein